jgi:hypothetical protein
MWQMMVILFWAVSAKGSVIGDFAPIKIGSEWKYSFRNSTLGLDNFLRVDSGLAEIKVLSKQPRDTDTLVELYVKEENRSRIFTFNSNDDTIKDTISDTAYSRLFYDTAIISGNSVARSAFYHCSVFPFYSRHFIDTTGLSRVKFGGDTLYSLIFDLSEFDNSREIYFQNVGLYSRDWSFMSHSIIKESIRLVSFNGTAPPASARNPLAPSRKSELPRPGKFKKTSLTHAKPAFTAYSIAGKKMRAGAARPAGIVIGVGGEARNPAH